MDFQHCVRSETGKMPCSENSGAPLGNRQHLDLKMNAVNTDTDSDFRINKFGAYECKLCLNHHNNEESNLDHSRGTGHQHNSEGRPAKDTMDALEPSTVSMPPSSPPPHTTEQFHTDQSVPSTRQSSKDEGNVIGKWIKSFESFCSTFPLQTRHAFGLAKGIPLLLHLFKKKKSKDEEERNRKENAFSPISSSTQSEIGISPDCLQINNMDNFVVDDRGSSVPPPPPQSSEPGEDIVEPVNSSMPMENDNVISSNNVYNNSTRCLEPVGRMIIPRAMDVNPFATPRDFSALKSEQARLESFSQPPGWPIPFIRPEDCARAGFFFLQDGDKVQCAFCRGVAGEWEQGDNPMAEHRRHFPRCPFICGLPVGNIELGQEEMGAVSSSQEEGAGMDICGPYTPDLSQLNLASDQPASVRGAQPLGGNGNEVVTSLGIKTCGNGPAHPSLVTVHSRIKTFTNWPAESGQTPETMAEAGFFYIGRRDHVKCFYCDGGLRNWEASDDPWLEHARWFANCTYVILNKGDSFVKEVSQIKPPVISKSQNQVRQMLSLKRHAIGFDEARRNFKITILDPQYLKRQALTNGNPPRRVSDQELRELIDTPIVQAALEMGMELGKVKSALQRKIQQTGQPFLTTEALLEAVLGRDSEYESDSDTDTDDNDEEENLSPAPRQRPSCPRPNNTSSALNMASFNGIATGSSSEASSSSSSSSSSSEHSSGSGDEETITSSALRPPSKAKSTGSARSASGDSGTSSMTPECVSCEEDEEAMSTSSSEKDNDLEEEVRKLREQTLCKICMDNQVGIVFLPCGHLVSCTRCATALSNCALCRQPIKAVVRTYLS